MIQESFVKKIFEMFEMFVAKTAVINCYYICIFEIDPVDDHKVRTAPNIH